MIAMSSTRTIAQRKNCRVGKFDVSHLVPPCGKTVNIAGENRLRHLVVPRLQLDEEALKTAAMDESLANSPEVPPIVAHEVSNNLGRPHAYMAIMALGS
jgi:hypothetical protein